MQNVSSKLSNIGFKAMLITGASLVFLFLIFRLFWVTSVDKHEFAFSFNRFSFNGSYPEEYRGWRDVMRGYAYSTKRYPFIKILEEYKEK